MKDLINRLRTLGASEELGDEAADALEAQQAEIEALKSDLETERIRLAACGVVALSDTPESAASARQMKDEYRSASCDDVARRVDECMRLRAEIEALRAERTQADDFTKAIANACQEAEKQVIALMEDKDRLDWLEANPRHAQIIVDGVATDCVFYGISCAQLMKLREAIDSVRRK